MENLRFGTMYEGGMPISPSSNANATMGLTLGDTVPGKEIRWLEFKNLLIADRCVCTGISWDDLRQAGLLDGKPVKIDGKDYLCRSLKVGSMPGEPNEWDDALNALGEDDKDWHWLGDRVWGRRTRPGDRKLRKKTVPVAFFAAVSTLANELSNLKMPVMWGDFGPCWSP